MMIRADRLNQVHLSQRRDEELMNRPRVAFVTSWDPDDVRSLSGSVYFVRKALEAAGLDVTIVAPLTYKWRAFHEWVRRGYDKLGKEYRVERAPIAVRHFHRQADEALRDLDVDVIFSPEAIPICRLQDPRPVVFHTDATFDGLVDYYAQFTNLPRACLHSGRAIDQAALSRCTLAIYTSEWAAETARTLYDVDPAKLRVVPLGANVTDAPPDDELAQVIANRQSGSCELLFIAREWVRKGGPKALEIVAELARRGRPAQLTIIGPRRDIPEHLRPIVRQLGFLSKSIPAEAAQWRKAMTDSHFLILPTEAECFSFAAVEACAFAMPVLATRTGGLPEVVRDGENGRLFDLKASAAHWCDCIESLLADRSRYEALCRSASTAYQERLNWQVNGAQIAAIVEEAYRGSEPRRPPASSLERRRPRARARTPLWWEPF